MDNQIFQSMLSLSSQSPAAIKEVISATEQTTYIAYQKRGAVLLSDALFSVCRVQKTIATGITTFMWADGSIERQFAFDSPETLTYSFLK